jgi:hypothetical protein
MFGRLVFFIGFFGIISALTLADCCHYSTWGAYGLCQAAVTTRCDNDAGTNDVCYPKCNSAPQSVGNAWCNLGPQSCAILSNSGRKRNSTIVARDEEQETQVTPPYSIKADAWNDVYSSYADFITRTGGQSASNGGNQNLRGTGTCSTSTFSAPLISWAARTWQLYWSVSGDNGNIAVPRDLPCGCSTEGSKCILGLLSTTFTNAQTNSVSYKPSPNILSLVIPRIQYNTAAEIEYNGFSGSEFSPDCLSYTTANQQSYTDIKNGWYKETAISGCRAPWRTVENPK